MIHEKKIDPPVPLNEIEKQLLSEVDKRKQALTKLLQDLVKIDSRNYSEKVYADKNKIMRFVENYLANSDIKTELYKVEFPFEAKVEEPYYLNLVANLFENKDDTDKNLRIKTKKIQFNGHLDTVPFNEERWAEGIAPLGGTIQGNKLYGRGACDMKSGVSCQIMAMKILKDIMKNNKITPKGDLQLWLTPDEETHGRYGSLYMVKNHLNVVNSDITIISESSAVSPLESPGFGVGEKGPQWLKFTFYGVAGHGSMPKAKSNALNKATRFMSMSKRKLKMPKGEAPLGKLDMIKTILKRYKLLDLFKLFKTVDTMRDPLDDDGMSLSSLFHSTFSFDKISAGTKVNVIPDQCELEVDFRVLPGINTQDLLTKIAEYCAKLNYRIQLPEEYENPQDQNEKISQRPIDVKLEILTIGQGSYEDPNVNHGEFIFNCFSAVYEVAPIYFFSSGFTDAGNMREAGMDNIFVFGPSGGNFHDANEYADIESLSNATKFYLLTAYRYLTS
ncbi:MAG: M20/M25/M40 family metallo-hydrolase [Candidatus Lokiarchaeota archaeon]|nr:M20/M25/M40 family metallo-hydrolase [Candidatus Lokiarchaeota archaeon]